MLQFLGARPGSAPAAGRVEHIRKNPKTSCPGFLHGLLPVALLSSVACELAPLKIVFYVFFFFYFYLPFYTCNVCNDYVRQENTLDIGQRYTNLIQDTLYTDPAWPLEIFGAPKLTRPPQ